MTACVSTAKAQHEPRRSGSGCRRAAVEPAPPGDTDGRVPYRQGELADRLIPGARFVSLDSQNHLLLESEPAWRRFLEEAEAFLPGTASASPAFADLTPRERDLLELIAQGRDNAQVAATLGLSEKTVRNHITHIFAKLEVETRAQAIVLARNAGFGRPGT